MNDNTPPGIDTNQPLARTPKVSERRFFTLAQIEEAAQDQCGFCLACGAINTEVEPDARRYPCEECEAEKVYGTDALAEMGRVS